VRRSLLKRGLRVAVAGGVAVAALLSMPAAFASPQNPIDPHLLDKNTVSTADDENITIAGSDTLDFITRDIVNSWPATVKSHVFDIDPGGENPAPVTTVGDANCGVVTYDPAEGSGELKSDVNNNGKMWPPNGSGEGRTALKQSADSTLVYGKATIDIKKPGGAGGCIDIARSSAGPGTTDSSPDPTQFEFYGFALDGVSWATTSLEAPNQLTLTQVRNIYSCANEATAGLTPAQQAIDSDNEVDNWAEVGGSPGLITRVIPQTGSGTRTFFINTLLGGSTPPTGGGAGHCPTLVQDVQENKGSVLRDSAHEGAYDTYILPYSAGKWVFQVTNKINPTKDVREGVRIGALVRDSLNGSCPSTPVAFANTNSNGMFNLRFNGADFTLNNASLVCYNTFNTITSGGQFDTSLDAAAPGTFSTSLIGLNVQGDGINDGTVVADVINAGQTLVITPGATKAFTGSINIGIPPVSEFNPQILSNSGLGVAAGVRELFHIVDTRNPSYAASLALVGFEAGTANKSPLCDGANAGDIVANGFLDLAPVTNNGTGLNTCRLL